MNHTIYHDLDAPMAKRALEKAAESYRARFASYDPSFTWENDERAVVSFKALGMTAKGTLTLKAGAVDVTMEVPFVLRAFRQKAMSVVEEEVRHWVEKAKAGSL